MKDFQVEEVAQAEFEDATGWYEDQRDGLGLEFVAEVRIADTARAATRA